MLGLSSLDKLKHFLIYCPAQRVQGHIQTQLHCCLKVPPLRLTQIDLTHQLRLPPFTLMVSLHVCSLALFCYATLSNPLRFNIFCECTSKIITPTETTLNNVHNCYIYFFYLLPNSCSKSSCWTSNVDSSKHTTSVQLRSYQMTIKFCICCLPQP